MQTLEMEETESFLSESNRSSSSGIRSRRFAAVAPKMPVTAAAAVSHKWRNLALAAAVLAVMLILHNGTSGAGKFMNPTTPATPSQTQTVPTPATAPTPATPSQTAPTPATPSQTTLFPATTANQPSTLAEEKEEPVPKGNLLSYSKLSHIVPDPEHVPVDDATKKKVATEFGRWHFWDGDEQSRPSGDYCGQYANRDIPGDEFPDEAWQGDAVFVNHIVNDAEELVSRAMEAIFVEYGHGHKTKAEDLAERLKMFHWDKLDLLTQTSPPNKYTKHGDRGNGGWTTERSLNGLVRRLLHAIMTNDTFTVVLGGHSAAAGHGNHFRQSYMMQFHKILAPIFARLGVKLVTKNMSQGGLGTIHNAMGMGSLYGNETDLLLWDSGMTERGKRDIELFLRQGLLGGNRVPVVWGGGFEVLRMLHQHADVDVGEFGEGTDGIIKVEDEVQAKSVPYAARYLKCDSERQDICNSAPRYCTKCWIPREDLDPKALGFSDHFRFGGQVKWHPGWRHHQLVGRTLAFSVLQALQAAIQVWSDGTMGGPPLDENFWHVTGYYDNIRTKLKSLNESVGHCFADNNGSLPPRLCNTPMKARSLHTPRANPSETSIVNLLKPASDGYVPRNEQKMMYEGPDVHNTCYDIPTDEMDLLTVVTGRRRLDTSPREPFDEWVDWNEAEIPSTSEEKATHAGVRQAQPDVDQSSRQLDGAGIVPGKGWQVVDEPPGRCDGEYDSICGRAKGSDCPLWGHHDHRGMVAGHEYSGWLVMEIPDVKAGIIMIKLFTWIEAGKITRTEGWTSVNNEQRRLRDAAGNHSGSFETTNEDASNHADYVESEKFADDSRHLTISDLPDTFAFDYSINGKISTLNKAEFVEKIQNVQRVIEIITLLDDPNFTKVSTKVEVAFRMRGCGRICTFGLTHVYWA